MEPSFNREQFGKLKSEVAEAEFIDGAHEEGLTLDARIDELLAKKAEIEEELISIRGDRGFESMEEKRRAISLFTEALQYESDSVLDIVVKDYGEYFDIDKYPKAYSTFIEMALNKFLGSIYVKYINNSAHPERVAWLIKLMDMFPKDESLFLSKAQKTYLSGNSYTNVARDVLLQKTGMSEEELRKSLISAEALDSLTEALYLGEHGIRTIKYLMDLYPENQEIFTKVAFKNFEERIKSGRVINSATLAEFPTFKETQAYQDMLPNVADEIKELLSFLKDTRTGARYRDPAWPEARIILELESILERYPELDVKEIAPYIQKAYDESDNEHKERMLGICNKYNIELNT